MKIKTIRLTFRSRRTLSTQQRKQTKRKAREILSEAAAKTEAILPKKKRGGPRPGAGRKPNYLKKSGLPPILAHTILAQHDVPKLWSSLLNSKNEHVRLNALMYLTNREQGFPKQVGEFRSEHYGNQEFTVRFVGRDEPESKKKSLC